MIMPKTLCRVRHTRGLLRHLLSEIGVAQAQACEHHRARFLVGVELKCDAEEVADVAQALDSVRCEGAKSDLRNILQRIR